MTIRFGTQKNEPRGSFFLGSIVLLFHRSTVPLFYRSIAPSFPRSVIPLLSPQFYGFVDDENEGDEGEQTGKEKGERFAVKAVTGIKAVASAAS